jgi:hypothetical protein
MIPTDLSALFVFETADAYHAAAKDHLGSHGLADFRKSPRLHHWKQTGLAQEEDRPAYLVGRAAHTLVLEGREKFLAEYAIGGPINPRTGEVFGANTKAFAEWAEAQGKSVLTDKQAQQIEQMAAGVLSHELARQMLASGVAEAVLRAMWHSVPCQVRIDWFSHLAGAAIVDAYADRVWVQNLRGYLQDVFTLGAYFESLQPGRFKVIILDAFYRFMPRDMDENDNGTMASLYNHIDRYADLLGCSFVLIHHTTKGNQSAKSITDVGAGAGSQSRATDTHMILRPHEEPDAVVLDAAVRSWPPVAPRCLRWSFPVWSAADDLDPAQLRSEGGKKRCEKKDEWSPESFVEAFVDDEPATRSAIIGKAVRAGLSKWASDNLLRMADADGLMVRQGDGKRNEPYTYQRAATPAQGEEGQP